jgi:hemolysin III
MQNFLTRFRDPTSSLTHFAAALFSVIGWIALLVVAWGDVTKLIIISIYSVSCVFLYLASGFYHMSQGDVITLNRLVKYDRVGIFLQIAGTYTPFAVYFLTGSWRVMILVTMWGAALVGSVYVMRYYVRGVSPRYISTLFYVAMGTAGIVAAPQFIAAAPQAGVILCFMGGGLYLTGAVIYSLSWPNPHPHYFNHHDIWHLFVMAAGGMFYLALLLYVVV